MIRAVFEGAALFLSPFVVYAVVLLLQRRNVMKVESWSAPSAWLAIAGLLLVLGSFIYAGLVAERPRGGFEPAHMEDGRLVPGRFR
jgi:hypothetical protein